MVFYIDNFSKIIFATVVRSFDNIRQTLVEHVP